MKLISTAGFAPSAVLALCLVAGCSSVTGSVNPAKYDKMTCVELNNAMGGTASEISQTAISRGKVANTSVPRWLLGGTKVTTAIANRETARIDRLKQQQDTIATIRSRKCSR